MVMQKASVATPFLVHPTRLQLGYECLNALWKIKTIY